MVTTPKITSRLVAARRNRYVTPAPLPPLTDALPTSPALPLGLRAACGWKGCLNGANQLLYFSLSHHVEMAPVPL